MYVHGCAAHIYVFVLGLNVGIETSLVSKQLLECEAVMVLTLVFK